jgi:hypothetical protein
MLRWRIMSTKPRKPKTKAKPGSKGKPKSAKERVAAHRARLRAQGLRPVQLWVPDLRNPKVVADLRRQGALLSKHPENDEIDHWVEAVFDDSGWK